MPGVGPGELDAVAGAQVADLLSDDAVHRFRPASGHSSQAARPDSSQIGTRVPWRRGRRKADPPRMNEPVIPTQPETPRPGDIELGALRRLGGQVVEAIAGYHADLDRRAVLPDVTPGRGRGRVRGGAAGGRRVAGVAGRGLARARGAPSHRGRLAPAFRVRERVGGHDRDLRGGAGRLHEHQRRGLEARPAATEIERQCLRWIAALRRLSRGHGRHPGLGRHHGQLHRPPRRAAARGPLRLDARTACRTARGGAASSSTWPTTKGTSRSRASRTC